MIDGNALILGVPEIMFEVALIRQFIPLVLHMDFLGIRNVAVRTSSEHLESLNDLTTVQQHIKCSCLVVGKCCKNWIQALAAWAKSHRLVSKSLTTPMPL